MTDQTVTERLRALLDERGVKHTDPAEWLTYWNDADGHVWSASEMKTGLLSVSTAGVGSLIPEQAIAATMGPETCHIDLVGYNEREDRFQCRSCDWSMWFKRGTWPRFNYCPKCGKRVIG